LSRSSSIVSLVNEGRSGVRSGRVAAVAVALAALLALPDPAPAGAGPSPAQLRKLTKQASQLNERYRGSIQSLEEIRRQAPKAIATSGNPEKPLAAAKADVAALAETSSSLGPIDATSLLGMAVEPHTALGQAANMNHMALERASRVKAAEKLIASAQKPKLQANSKIKKLEKEIKDLQSRRRELDRLLAKYG